MSNLLYILLAIAILLLVVLIHEFGHYVVGRLLKFKITEFSVGFGKALFSRKNKRGELISLRIFPLGGYCSFAGEEDADLNNKDAFNNQKPWKRILVFLAGVTFNFATAIFTSFILLCTIGYDIPQITSPYYYDLNTTTITTMVEGSEVESPLFNISTEDQLMTGDVVISINGEKIDFAYGINYNDAITQYSAGITDENFDTYLIPAVVKRGNEYKKVYLGFYRVQVYKLDESGKKILSEQDVYETEYAYYWNVNAKAYVHTVGEAFERSVPFAFGLSWTVLKSLWMLITFQLDFSAVGGPITTITTIANATQANPLNILLLIPMISANLAVFNLLPIPALDGSHVLFTTLEAIRKKKIKPEIENLIHTIGLFVLLGLVVLIDILHFLL